MQALNVPTVIPSSSNWNWPQMIRFQSQHLSARIVAVLALAMAAVSLRQQTPTRGVFAACSAAGMFVHVQSHVDLWVRHTFLHREYPGNWKAAKIALHDAKRSKQQRHG